MPKVVPTQIVTFIDGDFPFATEGRDYNVDMQFRDRVSALLRLVDELPDDLITFDGENYNRFVRAVETMRSTIGLWQSLGASTADFHHRRLGASITELRRLLMNLDDERTPATTAGLPFIEDYELRESIRADIAAADAAFIGQEWKAATVLGGAVVEALLLWAIGQRNSEIFGALKKLKTTKRLSPKIGSDPQGWSLETYKVVAEELGIISGNAVLLITLAQGFRNLIHPGKAIRTGERCTRSTAHSALAAMARLIEDFSRRAVLPKIRGGIPALKPAPGGRVRRR
jgi:hypothetical protein